MTRWLRDTVERVVNSAAAAALAVMSAASFNLLDVKSLAALAVAAGTAALYSAIKALVAVKIGDPDSASLDPKV